MLEVERFLEELDVDPLLTQAAAKTFRRSNDLGLAAAFHHEPEHIADVIEYLDLQSRDKRRLHRL